LARRAVAAAAKATASSKLPGSERRPALPTQRPLPELSILFTDDTRMQALNKAWCGKEKPTNVLSFPHARAPSSRAESSSGASPPQLLGDVILSAETVAREAALADKPLEDHMAHLIIHGLLHLLGFNHEEEEEAEIMEQLERVALGELGIPDPYATASGE
jgi:probable rRNA maturation factor